MIGLFKFFIRFIIYVVILIPLVTNILGGSKVAGVIAFLLVAVVASILEVRGIMKTFVNSILGLMGKTMKKQNNALAETLGEVIAPDETVVTCPSCGAQATLKNGSGKCDTCGNLIAK